MYGLFENYWPDFPPFFSAIASCSVSRFNHLLLRASQWSSPPSSISFPVHFLKTLSLTLKQQKTKKKPTETEGRNEGEMKYYLTNVVLMFTIFYSCLQSLTKNKCTFITHQIQHNVACSSVCTWHLSLVEELRSPSALPMSNHGEKSAKHAYNYSV